MARKRKIPEPPSSIDTTGSLLIRAAAAMERFDEQLERSRELASVVREELDKKRRKAPRVR